MSIESDSTTDAGVCYRHPKRESRVRCQRCGRPICPDCQVPAAVGVQCPECVSEGHAPMAQPMSTRVRRALRPRGSTPIVTYSLIAACVLIYALQWITQGQLTNAWFYAAPLTAAEPWRMITSTFLHSQASPLHLLFNMYSLFIFGPVLESLIGRVRFLVLYLVSGFAGSVAVLLLAPNIQVLGASGAIFGLMGAYFVITRHLGRGQTQVFIVIALNLVIGFVIPGVAWQAHLGGLIAGVAVSLVYVATRRRAQRPLQILGVAGIVVALAILTVIGVVLVPQLMPA